MSIGKRILQFRTYMELCQGNFATKINVKSYTTIARWEKDQRVPTATDLEAMQKLGLNINWLLSGDGKMIDSGVENNHIVPISKIPKENFKIWLDEYWDNADEKERELAALLFKRMFPDYNIWLEKKNLGTLKNIEQNQIA